MYHKRTKTKNILTAAGDFFFVFVTMIMAITTAFLIVIKLIGWNMFSVDSPSMSPQYPVDSLIIVQKIDPDKIIPGNVITFTLDASGTIATHRVVSVNSISKTFTTKGDANTVPDAVQVQWENVVGKVILGIPWLGKPLRIFTDEDNRLAVVAVIAVLFTTSIAWDTVISKKARSIDDGKIKNPPQ